jgi:hypothetical protein
MMRRAVLLLLLQLLFAFLMSWIAQWVNGGPLPIGAWIAVFASGYSAGVYIMWFVRHANA